MKFSKLFLSILAAASLVAGCKPEEPDSERPMLSISNTEIAFQQTGGSQTFTVTANRDWSVATDADWIAIAPESGKGSSSAQTVTLTALSNASNDRSATVKVKTDYDYKTIVVSQPGAQGVNENETATGTGTKEDPFNVIAAIALAKSTGETASAEVYVKGKVSKIDEINTSSQFGNATYYISTDGTESNQFQIYRGKYLGNKKFTSKDQLKVGDEVIVYGQVVNFKGNTPEMTQGGYIYSLNGKVEDPGSEEEVKAEPSGSGTEADPYNVSRALDVTRALSSYNGKDDLTASNSKEAFVKGIVSELGDFSAEYGNYTYYITDGGGTTARLYVFRGKALKGAKFESAGQLNVGDEVIVKGTLVNYSGKTPEFTAGNELASLNGETGTEPDPPVLEEVKTVTIAEFNAAEVSETQPYQLTGKISGDLNDKYGNFDLVDETGTVYVYGLTATNLGFGAKNDQSFASLGLKVGDTVTLIGFRGVYDGKTEVLSAYYVSHVAGEGDTTDYTAFESRTVAGFIAAADAENYFRLTGTVSNYNVSSCRFDLTDDSGSIYVYSVNNSSEWSDKIKNGGTVELAGKYSYYEKDNKHEVVSAHIISYIPGEGGEDNPGGNAEETEDGIKITWSSQEDWTGVVEKANVISLSAGGFTITADKNGKGSNAPTVNAKANDARVYANQKVTVSTEGEAMTKIVFNISDAGVKRLTVITSDTGEIAAQGVGDKTVTWTGSASSVTFTVGDKATFGTERYKDDTHTSENAGQFDFSSVIIK